MSISTACSTASMLHFRVHIPILNLLLSLLCTCCDVVNRFGRNNRRFISGNKIQAALISICRILVCYRVFSQQYHIDAKVQLFYLTSTYEPLLGPVNTEQELREMRPISLATGGGVDFPRKFPLVRNVSKNSTWKRVS